jgi:hypothetical protein
MDSATGEWHLVGSYASQREAQEAVRLLSEHKIDAEITGIGSRASERTARPMRRIGSARTALLGAVLGGVVGALFGMVLGLSLLTLPGLAIGAILGSIVAPAADPAVPIEQAPLQLETKRFDVMTSRERATEARAVLLESGLSAGGDVVEV